MRGLTADRWAARVFLRRAPGVAALLVPAGPRGWLAFAGLYAYFRVWDDRIDVPSRHPDRDLPRLAAEREARRLRSPGRERDALARALTRRPGLFPAVDGMWEALVEDAGRPRSAMPIAWLDAQQERIGRAYAGSLWICLGHDGPVPQPLVDLARWATAVHALRDLHEDLGLGYVNVPSEVCEALALDPEAPSGEALGRWRRQQAAALAQQLDRRIELSGRVGFVFRVMASRYRDHARQIAGGSPDARYRTSTVSAQRTASGW